MNHIIFQTFKYLNQNTIFISNSKKSIKLKKLYVLKKILKNLSFSSIDDLWKNKLIKIHDNKKIGSKKYLKQILSSFEQSVVFKLERI